MFYEPCVYSRGKRRMSKLVKMPTEDELAELSVSELNECIRVAF
jgi:hypothetical protein